MYRLLLWWPLSWKNLKNMCCFMRMCCFKKLFLCFNNRRCSHISVFWLLNLSASIKICTFCVKYSFRQRFWEFKVLKYIKLYIFWKVYILGLKRSLPNKNTFNGINDTGDYVSMTAQLWHSFLMKKIISAKVFDIKSKHMGSICKNFKDMIIII